MGVVRIRRADDPRLEPFRSLRERDLAGREGLFVGEGPLTVELMLRQEGVTRAVLVRESWLDRFEDAARRGVEVLVADESTMSAVTGFEFHRGVLAVGRRAPFQSRSLEQVLPRDDRATTLLLVDGVTNVDNVAALFRNAAAFGCDAVVLSPDCHDPLYRKALRVSLGHVLSLPWCRVGDWGAALEELRARGFEICAAALGPDAVALDDFAPPRRVALAVGQESAGVSAATIAAADAVLRIPMAPGIDSLNVAVASAVCLHRLSRGERR